MRDKLDGQRWTEDNEIVHMSFDFCIGKHSWRRWGFRRYGICSGTWNILVAVSIAMPETG